MTREEKRALQRDIVEAFDFVRYIAKDPKVLRKIRNGSEIRITAAGSGGMGPALRSHQKVQFFTSETVFHPFRNLSP